MATKNKFAKQEELAKKLGDLLLINTALHVENLVFVTKRTGDYILTLFVDKAEGRYEYNDAKEPHEWTEPGEWLMRFGLIVQDRDYKTFVPDLDIVLTITDKKGAVISKEKAKYMWHPYAQHYGLDVTLEEDGEYTVHADIEAPTFDRMHVINGKRYEDEINVKLGSLSIIIPGYQDEDGSESLRME